MRGEVVIDENQKKNVFHVQKCSDDVEVGKNRNTKLKRQSIHVLSKHFVELFDGLNVCERYKCLRCSRKIPVYKSPCDHITEYHIKEDVETEFSDLWYILKSA